MRIAGLVILFQPSDSVIQNMSTYLPFLDKLIICDNTEAPNANIHDKINKLPNVTLIHDGENKGIAKRLNEGVNICIKEKFSWLLTMDQDSYFEKQMFEQYLSCLEKLPNKHSVAMVGTEFEKKLAAQQCSSKNVKHLITSGSIINLQLFDAVGGFDEALFIDDVDTDYCYNAVVKGYTIVKFDNIFLNHSLGNVSFHKSLKSFQTTARTLHSPIRLYYMCRNYFYINSKYPDLILFEEKIRRKKDLLHRIKNNLLYGKNRLTLIHSLLLSWLDFRRKRMGKKQ